MICHTAILFVPEHQVCDEEKNMDCDNGWDESQCAIKEGEQFYFGRI